MRAYAKARKLKIVAEYQEVESGRNRNRPVLAVAVAHTREAGGVLVVAKLDRLSRDARLVLDLIDEKLPLVFLDIPEADATTAAGEVIIGIMAVLARFESRRMGERSKAAQAQRKARGLKHKGFNSDPRRRKRACKAAGEQRRRATSEYRVHVLPQIEAMRAKGYTLDRVCDKLNAKGMLTFSGRKWTVANLAVYLSGRNRVEE